MKKERKHFVDGKPYRLELDKETGATVLTPIEQPCDGFAIVKTSKVKALLIAPIAAVCGWLILLYLISRR